MEQGIQARGLTKRFESGGKTVSPIKNLSLEVPEKSITAIVGESGSGKSTLLNILAGLDKPDEGSIILGGALLDNLSPKEMAQKRLEDIGIIFQFFNLLPTLTLLENISIPALLLGTSRSKTEQRGKDLLDELGIGPLAYRYPHEVSGGEIQRTAIARALINGPRCILADEPTGNLDPDTSKKITDRFRQLVENHGVSCIVVTHDESVSKVAERVLHLRDGTLHG